VFFRKALTRIHPLPTSIANYYKRGRIALRQIT